MPLPKMPDQPVGKPTPAPPPTEDARKPWKKKTPAETMAAESEKLRREIADTERDLANKRKALAKFEEARKIFESA